MQIKSFLKIFYTTIIAFSCGCTAVDEASKTKQGHLQLENKTMRLVIPDPTAEDLYYKGQRFTLPGMVIAADYQRVPLFTEMGDPRDPYEHDHVGGTASEYDINGPADYENTAVGDTFMKIGVGFLTRETEKDYSFSRSYPVAKRPVIKIKSLDSENVKFVQTLEEENGERGYRLEITVGLIEDGFTVERTLLNLGSNPIKTEHYSHNFSNINGREIGPDYQIKWERPLKIAYSPGEESPVIAEPNGIKFTETPEGSYYYSTQSGKGLLPGEPIKLTQKEAGITLAISYDIPLNRIAIWGRADMICPEPFVTLSLEPGESVSWTATYKLEQ